MLAINRAVHDLNFFLHFFCRLVSHSTIEYDNDTHNMITSIGYRQRFRHTHRACRNESRSFFALWPSDSVGNIWLWVGPAHAQSHAEAQKPHIVIVYLTNTLFTLQVLIIKISTMCTKQCSHAPKASTCCLLSPSLSRRGLSFFLTGTRSLARSLARPPSCLALFRLFCHCPISVNAKTDSALSWSFHSVSS